MLALLRFSGGSRKQGTRRADRLSRCCVNQCFIEPSEVDWLGEIPTDARSQQASSCLRVGVGGDDDDRQGGGARVGSKLRDDGLAGLQGEALYKKLGPLRKACLLNIARKASHRGTADNCWRFVRSLLGGRQDRIFALVDTGMADFLQASPAYVSADPLLHTPLPGFKLTGRSMKSRDPHANLQVTFIENIETGELAADIDIDESSGIQHGLEVIRNAVLNEKTNPYLIHEFLLAADPREHTLDPDYGFVFA